MAKPLTVRTIETLKPGAARREIPDGLMRGLFLIVQPTGRMGWAVRYRHKGMTRKYTIGTYPAIDLKGARELASRALIRVAGGEDPGAEKQAERRATREEALAGRDEIEAVCTRFVDRYAKPNTRETTWHETERVLKKHVIAQWSGRRLPDIGRKDIHELLDAIMDDGKPVLANRVHSVLRKMCGWAVERGIISVSPCAGIKPPATEQSRDRVLADNELRSVLIGAHGIGWPYGPIVKLLTLTGQRLSEVAEMRWGEVDLEGKTWTLPRERSKNDTEHAIPLSDAAIAVLKALPRIASKKGLVFTTTSETPVSAFSRAKIRLDELAAAAMEPATALPHWTLHDLRRTAASGMARLGIAVHVVEAVLNHRSGKIRGVARVYNRYDYADEKRRALEAWGRYVEQIVSGEPAANVVQLATARA